MNNRKKFEIRIFDISTDRQKEIGRIDFKIGRLDLEERIREDVPRGVGILFKVGRDLGRVIRDALQ